METRFSRPALLPAFATQFLCVNFLLMSGTLLAHSPPMIATGWDSPTPARFRENLSAFEALEIFDGTTIAPTRTLPSGKTIGCGHAFIDEPWQWADFQAELADLQAATPTTATENFVYLFANPGNIDWFDDAAWENVTEHWRLFARLAKHGNLRGILFDAEPYVKPHRQFRYITQPNASEHTFDEFASQARLRGQQVMRAVAEEYPDITIMSYRLFCDMIPTVESGSVRQSLQTHTYGLLASFIDGWLDVAPETIEICEGNEKAYRFNSESQFDRSYTTIKLQAPLFFSPENQEKFRRVFTVGHGIYMDAHVSPPGSKHHIDISGSTSARRLRANVASAVAASDGYIWIYGERGRWWPGGKSRPDWEEKLPGATQALRLASDPIGTAMTRLKSVDRSESLLSNGTMEKVTNKGLPEDWFTWQEDYSQGTFAHQPSQATASGVLAGVLGQTVAVEPGKTYLASAQLRSSGNGFFSITIGWKSAEGDWIAKYPQQKFGATDDSTGEDWVTAVALVQVPEDAGQLVFMLGVGGQTSSEDQVAFRDCLLVKQPD